MNRKLGGSRRSWARRRNRSKYVENIKGNNTKSLFASFLKSKTLKTERQLETYSNVNDN